MYGQGGQTFVYHHEEDESSFQLVDTARIQKPQHQRSRGKYNQVGSKEKRIQSHVCSLSNIKGSSTKINGLRASPQRVQDIPSEFLHRVDLPLVNIRPAELIW